MRFFSNGEGLRFFVRFESFSRRKLCTVASACISLEGDFERKNAFVIPFLNSSKSNEISTISFHNFSCVESNCLLIKNRINLFKLNW